MLDIIDMTDPKNRHSYKKTPAIYCFENKVNGKHYVGSSLYCGKRIMDHLSFLRRNLHSNKHLQAAWDKYGEASFAIRILELTSSDEEDIFKREQYWIDELDTYKLGYNRSPIAERASGFTFNHSEETKKKMSEAKTGISFSDEHKASLSIARQSYKQSPETIEKARQANMGQVRTDETKQKLKEIRNANIGKANETVRKKGGRGFSGYKGVYHHRGRWQAKVCKPDGAVRSLGCFDTPEEAAKNYDYHMLAIYGEGCYLNFPEENYLKFTPREQPPKKNTADVSVTYNPNL